MPTCSQQPARAFVKRACNDYRRRDPEVAMIERIDASSGRDGIACRDEIASTTRSGSTFFLTVRTTKDVPLLGFGSSAKGRQSIHGDFCWMIHHIQHCSQS